MRGYCIFPRHNITRMATSRIKVRQFIFHLFLLLKNYFNVNLNYSFVVWKHFMCFEKIWKKNREKKRNYQNSIPINFFLHICFQFIYFILKKNMKI